MVHLLGIRHHGVGSAKNVLEQLEKIQPDIILIEGPPELDELISWVKNKDLKPPVAILGYNIEQPQQATFYPYAEFSPEWLALLHAQKNSIPVRMMDLPLSISFELVNQAKAEKVQEVEKNLEKEPESQILHSPLDPMDELAKVAGFENSEDWWETYFEEKLLKNQSNEHFEAVLHAMQSLRECRETDEKNKKREAYMRHIIRQTQNEIFTNIVVICGAWHVPSLLDLETTQKEDAEILKKMPKKTPKVGLTWVPWTNDRLSLFSGYGAGLTSPGWYEHLWKHGHHPTLWLTKVAQLFRTKKMDISTAHIIESVRLAHQLAALRHKSNPSLLELNEATQTVMCMGDHVLLSLVKEELIVGKKMGKVPKDIPKVPLEFDFDLYIKKLRLSLQADSKEMELDLRQPTDLKRSIFFHRLAVLDVGWAKLNATSGKGTFKESWTLRWRPEVKIDIIEKGFYGNTIEEASTHYLLHNIQNINRLGFISESIQKAIPAELFEALEVLLKKISELSIIFPDVIELMEAFVPLSQLRRYGNVRKTDLTQIEELVLTFAKRISIGLPNASYGLSEETSITLFDLILKTHESIRLLDTEELSKDWFFTLEKMTDKEGVHAIIRGGCTRKLFEVSHFSQEIMIQRFRWATSSANSPSETSAWLEGFLKGSATVLLLDNSLWNPIYEWVEELEETVFMEQLPILRRTFSEYGFSERRQLGEKAKKGIILDENQPSHHSTDFSDFNSENARKMFPVLELLFH